MIFECLAGEAEQYPIRQHKTVHYSPITVHLPNHQNAKLRAEAMRLFMHFVDSRFNNVSCLAERGLIEQISCEKINVGTDPFVHPLVLSLIYTLCF